MSAVLIEVGTDLTYEQYQELQSEIEKRMVIRLKNIVGYKTIYYSNRKTKEECVIDTAKIISRMRNTMRIKD